MKMWLQIRMYLLLAAMFGIVYALLVVVAGSYGVGGFFFYAILASVMLLIQYMIGPKMVEWSMKIRYVSEQEEPELHRIVSELSQKAGIKKPRVCISGVQVPNAFAFGRSISDGRVCVTSGIMNLLSKEELRAVLGHEISHLKNRDVMVITMLSVIPMICWYLAWSFMFSGGRNRDNTAMVGLVALALYFITNLLVLYGSRIREYYADKGSVELGNQPHHLASALYKLVYGSARADRNALKQMEGYKAFFLNDPSRAANELREMKVIDSDMSGSVDQTELMNIRNKKINVSGTDKFMEMFSTHPNMLKRIKHLSELSG
ncbi:MAG: M48 family metalloprotease [Candidatus Altiarchaeota archaeon]|nr:M48 family metalloprotease [Candidatus Altiarchaeota archaeon]